MKGCGKLIDLLGVRICLTTIVLFLYCNAVLGNGNHLRDMSSTSGRDQNFNYQLMEPGTDDPRSPSSVSLVCSGAQVACSNNIYSYPAGQGVGPPPQNGYPDYGCIGGYLPGPAWFYMQVGVAGDIIIFIQGTNDVDFICWGPFTSLTDGCASGLTAGNIVDCSFSPSATETCHILNAQVGQIYILLITNFTQFPGIITFQQIGGTGQTNCELVVHCSMIDITSTPSTCNGATNTYSVSGNMEFSNPPATGTLTITDITALPPLSQTLYPPFVSPLAYNITNIPCDGALHTLSAVFSDSLTCTLTKQYTAPAEICPQAQISGGGEICNDGTSTANITISITGIGPFDFTYAINGVPQTPVTGYIGPLPYVFGTNIPGNYTMVSLSNAACPGPGSVSGSAVVIVNPLPVPTITGNNTVCSGSAGNVYETESGMSNYQWTISPGGVISAGGGPIDYTATVTWITSGPRTLSVNYTNGQGCHAASATIIDVNVKPTPVVTNAVNSNDCSGTTINIIPVSSVPGTVFSWTASGSSPFVTGFSSGSGTSINDQLVNSGFNFETVTYAVTPSVNGCTGLSANFVVTVIPVPDVYFNPATQTICSGLSSNIQIKSHVNGATFSWTVSGSSPNISGFSDGIGNTIQQTLNNSGFTVETVTYHVTPVVNGCTGTPANVIVTVNPSPIVSLTNCWDTITITTAQPFRLKGGIPLGGTYSGQGVTNGIFYPAIAGIGTHQINYTFTNALLCSVTGHGSLSIINPVPFTCGNPVTDVRDGKTYPTVQIGSQCWMAANLDYGVEIPFTQHQRDNCIPEKYTVHSSPFNDPSFYQWDELMQYDESVSNQGFCPPGWHVPSESDWKALFSNYINNGFAGSPLKSTGFSGFNALLSAAGHLNRTWDYMGFATFLWSSTAHGTNTAWSHGMNDTDPSVSAYPAFRSNAFSVRCIRD